MRTTWLEPLLRGGPAAARNAVRGLRDSPIAGGTRRPGRAAGPHPEGLAHHGRAAARIDARAQVARLSRSVSKAPQSEVDAANARYVAAKIDSDIRKTIQRSLKGARLDDTQVAHLVGLVLALGGVTRRSTRSSRSSALRFLRRSRAGGPDGRDRRRHQRRRRSTGPCARPSRLLPRCPPTPATASPGCCRRAAQSEPPGSEPCTRQDRKRAKRAARRSEHRDKYADQRETPDDREMSERLAVLAEHYNGEADRG